MTKYADSSNIMIDMNFYKSCLLLPLKYADYHLAGLKYSIYGCTAHNQSKTIRILTNFVTPVGVIKLLAPAEKMAEAWEQGSSFLC